jgi:membrane fusion protein, multidrug efflux system
MIRSTKKTTLLALALAIPALLAGCGGEEAPPDEAAAPPQEKKVNVRTVRPEPRRVVDVASLPADLLPLRRAVLAAEASGVVESLPVQEGQRVAAGKLIAAIDSRSLVQAVAEQEAVFREAEAQHERALALFEKRAITKQQLLDAVTHRDVSQARLASAKLQLGKSRVHAPWAGQISSKSVEVGDYVNPGQPLVELVDARRLKVRSPAPSSDVPFVKVGAPVTIRVDAYPGETFTGRIVRVGAELDELARTLDIEAEIDNPGGKLKPGMPARLEIARRTLEDAVTVPLEAVLDLGTEKAVYVVEEGRARRRTVALGPVVGDQVVVERGVAAGERVIVQGMQQVADGQPVEELAGQALAAGEV